MKESKYFPHDFGARNDPKLLDVLMDMGQKGIGIYWCLIEMMYEEGGKIELKRIKGIAHALNVSLTDVEQMLNKYDLFMKNDTTFWSETVQRRLAKIEQVRLARSKAGKASGEARIRQSVEKEEVRINVEQNGTNVEHLPNNKNKIKENKRKEIKEEKNLIKKDNGFKAPTIEEIEAYAKEKGYEYVDAEKFWNFYESKNWYVGKNKMSKWRSAVANWNKTEKERAIRYGTYNGNSHTASATRNIEKAQQAHIRRLTESVHGEAESGCGAVQERLPFD